MVYKSTDHRNDIMLTRFFFLVLELTNFGNRHQAPSMSVLFLKNKSTTINFPWSMPLQTIEMMSKCPKLGSETRGVRL